jgi:outer membrane protein OmpU
MIAIRNAWGEKRCIPNSDSPELGTTFDTRGKTMKKVLLATTALALSAGVAYAEVSVSGNARMGLTSNDGTTALEKRMTVNIAGSAETTSGLSLGASMNVRSNENSDTLLSGAKVSLSAGGATVAVGNIDGALESMPGMYSASAGLTGLGWGGVLGNTEESGYWGWDAYSSSGNGSEGVEVIYSAGSVSAHLSYSDEDLGSLVGAIPGSDDEDLDIEGDATSRVAAYVSYAMGDWTVAAGMQDSDNNAEDKTVVTVGGKVGDFGVGVGYADNDGETKIALNGSATFGATTVSAYVASEESADHNAIGIGVKHDLGGASLVGGVAKTTSGQTRADMGVSFSF